MATTNDTADGGNDGVLPSDPAEVTECPERGTVLAVKGKVLSYLVRKQAVNHSQEDYKQIRDHIDAPNDTVNEAIRALVADVNQFHFVASPGGHRDVLVITSSQYLSTARDWAEALDPDFDPDVVDGWSPDTGEDTTTLRFVAGYDQNGAIERWSNRIETGRTPANADVDFDVDVSVEIEYDQQIQVAVTGPRSAVETAEDALCDFTDGTLPSAPAAVMSGESSPAGPATIVAEAARVRPWVEQARVDGGRVGLVCDAARFEDILQIAGDDADITVVEAPDDAHDPDADPAKVVIEPAV